MNQLDVYCFTSIARTKSFSITARELMISQQAVSNHIKTLEEEVGYTLFFRYGQSAVLTKAGEILLDFFIKRDDLGADFFQAHETKEDGAPFLIAWTQWAGCPAIPESILKGFRKKYPQHHFMVADMTVKKLKEAIQEKKVDILFTSQYSSEFMSMAWDHTFICTQEICLVCSKKMDYSEKNLENYPFFTVPAGESNDHAVIERAKNTCEKMGFVPRNVYICDDLGSAYLNVITMNGLSFGTDNTALLPKSNFELKKTGVYSDYIMCSPHYTTDPAIKKFKDYVAESIKSIEHRSIKEAGQ